MKRYYLAYGSNLNVEQMKYRCPNARAVGKAFIYGYELLFKGSGSGAYLTIEKKEGGAVPVAVWEVTASDEEALDRYEGYPRFYYKKDVHITMKGIRSGRSMERDAFVYIMHEDRVLGIPDVYYIATCLRGYASFGFDKKYLADALKRSGYEGIGNDGAYMPDMRPIIY